MTPNPNPNPPSADLAEIEGRNLERATRASAALEAFRPGWAMLGMDERATAAVDLIANVFHAVRCHEIAQGIDPVDAGVNAGQIFDDAWRHFESEAICPDDLA